MTAIRTSVLFALALLGWLVTPMFVVADGATPVVDQFSAVASSSKSVNVHIVTSDGGDIPAGAELCLNDGCSTIIAPQHAPYTWIVDMLLPQTTYAVSLQSVYPYQDGVATVETQSESGGQYSDVFVFLEPVPPTGEIILTLETEDGMPIPEAAQVCVDAVCITATEMESTDFEHNFGRFAPGKHSVRITGTAPYLEIDLLLGLRENQSSTVNLILWLPEAATPSPTSTVAVTPIPTSVASPAVTPTNTAPIPTVSPVATPLSPDPGTPLPTEPPLTPTAEIPSTTLPDHEPEPASTLAVSGLPTTGSGEDAVGAGVVRLVGMVVLMCLAGIGWRWKKLQR